MWKCKGCKLQFSVKVGTILEDYRWAWTSGSRQCG